MVSAGTLSFVIMLQAIWVDLVMDIFGFQFRVKDTGNYYHSASDAVF